MSEQNNKTTIVVKENFGTKVKNFFGEFSLKSVLTGLGLGILATLAGLFGLAKLTKEDNQIDYPTEGE